MYPLDKLGPFWAIYDGCVYNEVNVEKTPVSSSSYRALN